MLELRPENGGLKCIEPTVDADCVVNVFPALTIIAEHDQPREQPFAVRDDRSAITVRAQILTGIETEATEAAERPHGTVSITSTVSLTRIFDDKKTAPSRGGENLLHVCRLTVEMDRYGRACVPGDCFLDLGRLDVSGARINIGQHR